MGPPPRTLVLDLDETLVCTTWDVRPSKVEGLLLADADAAAATKWLANQAKAVFRQVSYHFVAAL